MRRPIITGLLIWSEPRSWVTAALVWLRMNSFQESECILQHCLSGPPETPFTAVKLSMAERREMDWAGNNDMTQTEPGKPRSLGWEELCKLPQWLVCVGRSSEGGPVAASPRCGGWRCAALRWLCGSIPSGVIRGTQMKCSGEALSLTAAMCVCLFSFASRPLHSSLTILDLIIRYDAKVKIHSCFDGRDIVQQLRLALDGVIDPATVQVTTLCSLFSLSLQPWSDSTCRGRTSNLSF